MFPVDSAGLGLQFPGMENAETKLREAMAEFGCQTGTLHRAEGEWLHLVAMAGVPEFLLDKISLIPFGKGIAGVAAETKAPVELCNLQQDLGGVAKEDARKSGVSGSLAVPILSETCEVLGTLGVGKTEPYEFSEAEKERLAEIGRECRGLL
jgi:signal transduction protein with GAF and PtsI domain